MGSPPDALLAKLEPGHEVAAGKVRGLAAVVPALEAAGWVTTRKVGRTLHVQLTEAGVGRRAELAAAAPVKPARAAKPKAATPAARLAALEATVAAMAERLAALEAGLGAPAPASAPTSTIDVRGLVLDAVGRLDAAHRYGGLVPIPALRAELRRHGVADDRAIDDALDGLERDWKIDLSVAQAPTQVADRAAGIERPGRGLLYYVARR